MAGMSLTAAQSGTLLTASSTGIESAFARLGGYLQKERWLGTNNRYLKRPVDTVKAHAGSPGDTVHKHLAEYVAASAVLHSADAWAYLGRALDAHVRGDASVARHLGYYAELRGALALLATQGIGIFSSKNAIIDRAGQAAFFSGPTHQMTWLALEQWADGPAGASVLSQVIRPEGIALDQWVDGLGLGEKAWNPIGRTWLRTWGLDLKMFGRDRDTRNEASYRPTTLRESPPNDAQGGAEFIRQFWPLFEPGPGAPFGKLDQHLLRATLESAFDSVTGVSPVGNQAFRRALGKSLSSTVGAPIESSLGRFLTRVDDAPTPLVFTSAESRSSGLSAEYHLNVISRAALLLRLATGASLDLIAGADLRFDDMRFWCDRLAADHGLCGPGELPPDPADLWADVDDALELFEQALQNGSDTSFFSLLQASGQELQILTGCERIGIWGLAAA